MLLSYRSPDAEAARAVRDRLTGAGLRVWFDKVYLERHCEASRVVIPLLTPQWKESQWTRYATYGAERVVPLLLRGSWQEVATPPLALFQYDALDVNAASDAD